MRVARFAGGQRARIQHGSHRCIRRLARRRGVELFEQEVHPARRGARPGADVAEETARHFDDIILDDFFFTSCKSEQEIRAKGARTWAQYRVERMREVARDLVIGAARSVSRIASATPASIELIPPEVLTMKNSSRSWTSTGMEIRPLDVVFIAREA